MNEWLAERTDALAGATGMPRESLELGDADVETLLDLARLAAHDSGARTTAPLLCYVVGLARAGGATLDELAEILRSTS